MICSNAGRCTSFLSLQSATAAEVRDRTWMETRSGHSLKGLCYTHNITVSKFFSHHGIHKAIIPFLTARYIIRKIDSGRLGLTYRPLSIKTAPPSPSKTPRSPWSRSCSRWARSEWQIYRTHNSTPIPACWETLSIRSTCTCTPHPCKSTSRTFSPSQVMAAGISSKIWLRVTPSPASWGTGELTKWVVWRPQRL